MQAFLLGARKERNMPVSKGGHLVMFDRRKIEDMLRDGESVGSIAGEIGVSWAAVAREIKKHRGTVKILSQK